MSGQWRRSILGVLGVLVGLFVLGLLLFPYFASVRSKPSGYMHARVCALAVLSYAADSDGIVPFVHSNQQLIAVTHRYVWNNEVWWTLNPERPGKFVLNPSLPGVKLSEIPNRAETPMIVDPYGHRPASGDQGFFLVAFADGRVSNVAQKAWPEFRENLALRLPKHGKPLD